MAGDLNRPTQREAEADVEWFRREREELLDRLGAIERRLERVAIAAADAQTLAHALLVEVVPHVVTCSSRVSGVLSAGWREEGAGAGGLTFAHVTQYAAPDPAFSRSRDSLHPAIKLLAVVERGAVVRVVVPELEREDGALLYDDSIHHTTDGFVAIADGDPAVTFRGCVTSSVPTQFAGGFVVSGPRCLPLDVYSGSIVEPERIVISFGAGECR